MAISEFPNAKGYRLGPTENTFDETTEAAAEAARDAYFASNPTKLAVYDGNSFYLIRLVFIDGDVSTTRAQGRLAGAWFDYTPFLQGQSGEVASLAGVPVGEIPYKTITGEFAGSNMRVLESGIVLAPQGFTVESGSITFGEVLTLSEISGFLGIKNHLNDRQYTIVDFATPIDASSAPPSIFHLLAGEVEFIAQGIDTTNLPDNPLIFDYEVQNTAKSNKLKFRTYADMTNVRIKITQVSNGVTAKYIPSQQAWEEEFGGLDWVTGDNIYDFNDTPLIFNAGTDLEIEVRADVVALKGNVSGVPYFTAFLQQGEFRDVITDAVYTPTDVRTKIESLAGVNRLSATELKDVVYSVNAMEGAVIIGKADVGLGNVDNTSDVNKPVSTAQGAAITDAIAAHNAAVDPHPQYTTTAEASAAAPVQSVNILTGNVVLTTSNINEGANLYYSDSRVQNYITASGYNVKSVASVGAGSSVFQSNTAGAVTLRSVVQGTGGITVTQNTNDITLSIPTVSSGTYTPTLTNTTNITSSTAFQCQWMRVDKMVHVSGRVTIDPDQNNQATILDISLPVASNLANQEDLAGVAACAEVAGYTAAIYANFSNDRAALEMVAGTVASHDFFFNFMYEVI